MTDDERKELREQFESLHEMAMDLADACGDCITALGEA